MKDYIEERVLDVARYIIETQSTIRKAAKIYGCSKSTIHKDIVERLPRINPQVAKEAKQILDLNKSERHIRGGTATKLKYKPLMDGEVELEEDSSLESDVTGTAAAQ